MSRSGCLTQRAGVLFIIKISGAHKHIFLQALVVLPHQLQGCILREVGQRILYKGENNYRYYCKNQGNMRQAWLYTVNFWQTFLIQPLFLVVRVQQRYEELTGMGRGQLTWMLIACYCSCNQSIKDEKAGQQKLELSVHSNISTFWSHGLLTGRFLLRIRVKGATGD